MNTEQTYPRFQELLTQFLEENLSSAEGDELERLLLSSADLREEFYTQTTLHAGLRDHTESPSAEPLNVVDFSEEDAPGARRGLDRRRQAWLALAGIAAALVVGLQVGRESASDSEVAAVDKSPDPAPETTEEVISNEDPVERYERTMATLVSVGSQTRPPAQTSPAASGAGELSYNRDIRPILSDRCFACHGPDSNTREAGLRLDTPEGAYAALDPDGEWHQIKPGDPEKSEVFYRITTDNEDDLMPPEKAKLPRMTEDEIARIELWIRQGAKYEQHWAFTEIQRPDVPEAVWPEKARNEIDHFVQEKLNDAGFEPAEEADASTLLRRLTFDLTGLPPSSEQVQAVIDNGLDDEAWAALKKQYFDSVHHAEHFATRWLDKARYADTTGYQYDTPRIMWKWRDWVINAYHDNKPYDQFLTEQIAGDLLPDPTLDQIVATGYNRNHPITIEGGTIEEEYRVQYVSDRVNTIGSSVMGLTMECAKCHDHKYDPISQEDYFRMFAFFNNVPEGGRASGGKVGSELGAIAQPYIFAPSPEQEAEGQRLTAAINDVHRTIFDEKGEYRAAYEAWKSEITDGAGWQVLQINSATSNFDLEFEKLEDESWLLASTSPGVPDIYTFEIPMQGKGWRSLLLEALQHESLPNKGPGRSPNANAVLSKLELTQVNADGSETPVELHKVRSSYEQEGYPASNLISDPGGKGWGFFHPMPEDRSLIATMKKPFGLEGDWKLKVVLTFTENFGNHSWGRTRLSASREDEIREVPEALTDLLAKSEDKLTRDEKQTVAMAFLRKKDSEAARKLSADGDAQKQLKAEIPPVMVMEEMEVPRPAFVLDRGAYDAPIGDPVQPGSPEALNPFLDEYPNNRLGFTQWMTSHDNPLTARVAVNLLWDQLFGIGIVKTVEDFGSQGEWPSHPALLDWLAAEFMESGWDRQHIVDLITDSATYHQSSKTRPEFQDVDPENRLLAQGPSGRFSAEMIRDQALAVGGLLNPEVGGPGVNPYQPDGLWEELTLRPGFAMSYEESPGDQVYRRSIYTFWKRAAPPAMMSVFDAPSREICTVRRENTNTPLQALALLNGDTYVEAARSLAQQLLREHAEASDEVLIREAFQQIVHRSPDAVEIAIAKELFESESSQASDPDRTSILRVGRLPLDESLSEDRLLGLTMVNRLFFNLSETISRH